MNSKQDKGDQQLEYVGQTVLYFFKAVGAGMKKMWDHPACTFLFIVVTFFSFAVFLFRVEVINALLPEYESFHVVKIAVFLVLALPILCLFILGSSEGNLVTKFQKRFEQIHFCGRGGSYPTYKSQKIDGKKIIFAFYSPGIPVAEWRGRLGELETALDCNILKVEHAPNTKQIILLHTVPANQGIATLLPWSDDYISDEDFIICVGGGMLDQITYDLNKYPHALIAGVTGSGKSVILRCMLWQCIRKGARIYMIDFKGGVEFGLQYERYGEVVTDRESALELLKELVREMWERLKLFRATGVKNLAEYNVQHPEKPLSRIVLVCDEIAEMLDKAGLASSEKAIYYAIEKEISTLARLARAPGINMLLATQRPDAKVITGQIKNNLPIRISGRMVDKHASEMVLGNTKASDMGDTLGRFLYSVGSDTHEFQAYNFEDTLATGDYQKGELIIEDFIIEADRVVSDEKTMDELEKMISEEGKRRSDNIDELEGF